MTPEKFFSPRYYKRYLYAVSLGEKIEKLQKEGYYLINDNQYCTKDYHVKINRDFHERSWDVVSWVEDACKTIIIDIGYLENNKPVLPTKAEIREAFSNLRFISPKHIKKI